MHVYCIVLYSTMSPGLLNISCRIFNMGWPRKGSDWSAYYISVSTGGSDGRRGVFLGKSATKSRGNSPCRVLHDVAAQMYLF